MDMLNATMIVHQRICNIEPNLALDIVFHFLLNGFDYQNMIRLACGPNKVIASLAEEIKSKMSVHCSTPMSPVSPSLQPTINAIHESPTLSLVTHSEDPGCSSHHVPSLAIRNAPTTCDYRFPFCPVNVTPLSNADMIRKELAVQKYLQISENSQDGNAVWSNSLGNIYYGQESQMGWQGTSLRNGRMAVRFQEPQVKACYHYYKGYCKHGSSCKYFHGPSSSSDFSKVNHYGGVSNDNDPPSPGSLDKLEAELVELLKSKGEEGTSLAMLPLEYHEKYRKQLQAEGYMTESQRHGKAGFSLTKLITSLNSFRLIERPHGQHWVVLAEDALKHSETLNHVEFGSETLRNPENRVEVSGSRIETPSSQQIYLTFPAESTFIETDVAEYFSQFGEVVSVRLPPPPKRMYGFVTFAHPESAKRVLIKGTPHNICGARVLAKPYQAKIRKNNDKIAVQMHHPSQNLLFCDKSHASPRPIENSMGTHLEEQQRVHALETRWLNRVSLAPKQLVLRRYPYEIEESTSFQGTTEIQSPVSPLSSQLESLKLYTSEDKFRSSNNFSCQESNMTHLPDSLFDYPPRESNGPTLFKQ